MTLSFITVAVKLAPELLSRLVQWMDRAGMTLTGFPMTLTASTLRWPLRPLMHSPGKNRSESLSMSPIPGFGDASDATPANALGRISGGVAECAVAVISTRPTALSRR